MKELKERILKVIQDAHPDMEIRDLKVSFTMVAIVEEHEEVVLGGEEKKPGRKPGNKRGPKPGSKRVPKKGRRGRKKGSKNKPKANDDSDAQPLLQ